jgi:hypothetical protein
VSDEHRRDALGHLQAAAHELIEAGRAALDAADEVVSDRIRLMTMLLGRPPAASDRRPPTVEKIEIEPTPHPPDPPRPPGPEAG